MPLKTHERLAQYDADLREQYGQAICGVDECGRGAIAGPIVAAAVILPADIVLPGVNDSKKLTFARRKILSEQIKAAAIAYSIAMIEAPAIDKNGLTWANREVMRLAAKQAAEKFDDFVDLYVVDQAPTFPLRPHVMMPRADSISLSVAAASIVGKVFRDELMISRAEDYPDYNLDKNKGYIDVSHTDAVVKYGRVLGLHRFSYKMKALAKHQQVHMDDLDIEPCCTLLCENEREDELDDVGHESPR